LYQDDKKSGRLSLLEHIKELLVTFYQFSLFKIDHNLFMLENQGKESMSGQRTTGLKEQESYPASAVLFFHFLFCWHFFVFSLSFYSFS